MAHFSQQEEAQNANNERLAALAAAIMLPVGDASNPLMIQRELFTTNQTAGGVEQTGDVAHLATHDVEKMAGGLDPTTSNEIAEPQFSLQDIHYTIHYVTSSALQIELVLAEFFKTPLKRITEVKVLPTEKLCILYHSGDSDTTDNVMSLKIAIEWAHFIEAEKYTDFYQLFVGSLC